MDAVKRKYEITRYAKIVERIVVEAIDEEDAEEVAYSSDDWVCLSNDAYEIDVEEM